MFSAVTFHFPICLASIGYGEGDGEAEKWEGRDDMAIKWGQWGLLCAEGPWHHNPNITLVAPAFAPTQSLREDIIAKSKRFLEQEKCLASTHGLVLQGFQCFIFVRNFCLDLIMHLYALAIRPICSDAKWSGIFSKCIYLHTSIWQWHPTPVLLSWKSYGRRNLVGCSPWGREESDTTEWLHFTILIPVTEKSLMISILPALSPSHPSTPPNVLLFSSLSSENSYISSLQSMILSVSIIPFRPFLPIVVII